MTERDSEFKLDFTGLWTKVQQALGEKGIDIETLVGDGPRIKVVCVAPNLKATAEEMAQETRDQVVMVRVDSKTSKDLDAWVETGAVKSRSEAAALFIREGLNVRSAELDRLREALGDVETAKEKLRDKAREVFRGDEE